MNAKVLEGAPTEIDSLIVDVRGHKLILDSDLARLYGVPTKLLNQAVKRNRDKFPGDFLFQLNPRGGRQRPSFKVTICDLKGRHGRSFRSECFEQGKVVGCRRGPDLTLGEFTGCKKAVPLGSGEGEGLVAGDELGQRPGGGPEEIVAPE